MAASVEFVSLEFVKPSSPNPNRLPEIKFSRIDQAAGSMVSRTVYFFEKKTPKDMGTARKSQLLKQSLSLVLTKFYPFAGRINGFHSVICDDSGVLFLEAKADATLSKALQEMVPDEIGHFLPPHPLSTDLIRNSVPLAIQITYFRCGGMAMGVCTSHRIADGLFITVFMNSWAATCRGEPLKMEETKFDIGSELFPPLDPGIRVLKTLGLERKNESKKKIVRKRFVFDQEKIASLKRVASSQVGKPSRFEVVSAFIWKHVFESIRHRHSNKTTFVASIPIDFRKRLHPPVSNLALGNFLLGKTVSLKRDMEIDYGVLVGEFRNAVKESKQGTDYVKSLFECLKYMTKPELWACTFSSWFGFPVYGNRDFGWGIPVLFCPKASNPIVNLLDTRDGKGIEAWIHLCEDDMALLSTDLLSLATSHYDSHPKTSSRL